nr:50S ribosomal protein L25/general stress protein Ctc [Algibacillus agarilyticus]
MAMAIYELNASVRTDLGKGASRRLRHADKVPAIIYGGDKAPVSITFEHNKVFQASEFEGFYSHILTLNVDGEKVEALVKDIQRHPFKARIMHLDFQRVDASQKLHTSVPIHFVNEEVPVKAGGVVAHHANEIEITCLPADLPEFIEVDVADLEVGSTLHLSDVALPKGVSSVELAKGESHDVAVVTIDKPKASSEDEEASEEPAAE